MAAVSHSLTIAHRYCGPAGIANGGYCAGLLAGFVSGAARVTLRKPVPLDRPLRVESALNQAQLFDGRLLLAEAERADLNLDAPSAPTFAQAQATAEHYLRCVPHPSPSCFVCSPRRAAADRMRIFAGRVPERKLVAAAWTAEDGLADNAGRVRPEFMWAALDCPGYWAAMLGESPRMALLGQMTTRLDGAVHAGEPCVIIGWPLARSGRKHRAGTALFATDRLVGVALAGVRNCWRRPGFFRRRFRYSAQESREFRRRLRLCFEFTVAFAP